MDGIGVVHVVPSDEVPTTQLIVIVSDIEALRTDITGGVTVRSANFTLQAADVTVQALAPHVNLSAEERLPWRTENHIIVSIGIDAGRIRITRSDVEPFFV